MIGVLLNGLVLNNVSSCACVLAVALDTFAKASAPPQKEYFKRG
jgi:hypothetical protein